MRFISTVPATVSEISQTNVVYAEVETDLKCTIQGARQREVKVKWFKGGAVADTEDQSESGPLLVTEDLSDQACLQSDGRQHTSVLTVCLPVTEDQSKYRCVVLCRGKSFSREITVSVKGK